MDLFEKITKIAATVGGAIAGLMGLPVPPAIKKAMESYLPERRLTAWQR